MSILDGGPRRPTRIITAYHEDWGPGVGLGVPIVVPRIMEDDFIVSVQGRGRATGIVSEVTDWTITPGGGAVESPSRGLVQDDFLVMWYDRHQTADDLQPGDPGAGTLGAFNARSITGPDGFIWFKNEDIVFRSESAQALFQDDPTFSDDEKSSIKAFGGWSPTGDRNRTLRRILNSNAKAENGSIRVVINGRIFSAITTRQNAGWSADLNSSGFELVRPVGAATIGPPFVLGMVARNRDPLGANAGGTGGRNLLIVGDSSNNLLVQYDLSDASVLTGDDLTIIQTGANVITDEFFVMVNIYDGVNSSIRINGVEQASGDTGVGDLEGNLTVGFGGGVTGVNAGNGCYFQDWAEIFFNQPVGDPNAVAAVLEDYLLRKFGFRSLGGN